MEQVLKLDRDCEEAVNDLLYSKVQQLTVRTGSLIISKVFGSIPMEHNTKRIEKMCLKAHKSAR